MMLMFREMVIGNTLPMLTIIMAEVESAFTLEGDILDIHYLVNVKK